MNIVWSLKVLYTGTYRRQERLAMLYVFLNTFAIVVMVTLSDVVVIVYSYVSSDRCSYQVNRFICPAVAFLLLAKVLLLVRPAEDAGSTMIERVY